MDALSVLLQNVHLFETKYYRLNGAGNWSYSITRKDTILFYLVMSGGFCIDVGNGLREARAGDMIMSNGRRITLDAAQSCTRNIIMMPSPPSAPFSWHQ